MNMTPKCRKNVEIPAVDFIDGRLKFEIVFCLKPLVPHSVNQFET